MLGALAESPIFARVPVDELKVLVEHCKPVNFAAGMVLFGKGSIGDRLFFIARGKVEEGASGRQHDGKACFVRKGGLTGEVGVLSDKHILTAVARSNVDAFVISRDSIDRISEACPAVFLAIRAFCVKKLETVVRVERMNTHVLQRSAIQTVHQHTGLQGLLPDWLSVESVETELKSFIPRVASPAAKLGSQTIDNVDDVAEEVYQRRSIELE
eukprot:4374201-Pyramimonas_sp.AAC.1